MNPIEAIEKEKPLEGDQRLEIAKAVVHKQTQMGFWQSMKVYRKAVFWSMALSSACLSEGYDTLLIGSFLGQPSFNQTFGNRISNGSPIISASWQAALVNAAYIGEILGLFATGWLIDRYGNKKTMFAACLSLSGFVFLSIFGKTLVLQLVAQILCGFPWGLFQTATTVYAAEVLPVHLRGYLTSYVNSQWVIGQLIASGVLVAFDSTLKPTGWQIPYALQQLWPIPIALVAIFCPESPIWLVKHGRVEEAVQSVRRLQSDDPQYDIPTPEEVVVLHIETDKVERQLTAGLSYKELFSKHNIRRTEIAVICYSIQQMAGSTLLTYSVIFFENAGLNTDQAFNLTIGVFAIGFVGTVFSWLLQHKFGRRSVYLTGLFSSFAVLLIAGLTAIAPTSNHAADWAAGALVLVYVGIYDATLGPFTYVITSEIPSSRLRTKTIALARAVYDITNVWTGVLTPYMLNPLAWNWQGKSLIFWAGITLLCWVYAYFRIPETKNFTFAEIDALFEAGTPARKFKQRGRQHQNGANTIGADALQGEKGEKDNILTSQI